ncbi:MAG: aminotransferase class IV [Deltaproteobacteria bacterium]|nr:aminotransferase class IV [Deltaproteobacteria bacterium]
MNNIVFLKGRFLPANEASVSIFDRGFTYGDGLFETMRSYDGTIFALDLHWERLTESARTIEIPFRQSKKYLSDSLQKLLELNKLTMSDAYIKVIITRGMDYGRLMPSKSLKPTIAIIAKPLDVKKVKYYKYKGMGAIFLSNTTRPLPHVKSLNLLANIMGLIEANKSRMQEGILTNGSKILEGIITNIFIFDGKGIKTPPVKDGILPGITRRLVIDLAKKQGIKIGEVCLTKTDLKNSTEAFLTNSIMEIVPLVKIGDKLIGSGKAGAVTMKLQQAYKQMVLKQPQDRP